MHRGGLVETLRFMQAESGQTLPFTAISIFVLVGFLGIGIDMGHLRFAKRHLQLAADAAALAAGLELRTCGAANPCTAMAAAGLSSLTENGFTGATVSYNCSTMQSGALVLSLNTPPCALGSGDPNAGKSGFLEVQLQQPTRMFFAQIFGLRQVSLTARAEVWHGGGPCIYALDPNGTAAISVAAGLTSTCGIVDESTSANALGCTAGRILAPQITVAGGIGGLLCSVSPKPRTGAPVPVPADPLKYLATPSQLICGTSTGFTLHGATSATPLALTTGVYTLYPDKAYCGGLSIGIGAQVTFTPGVYVIRSTNALNGGLSINLLSTVVATGVTFYNAGPNGAFSMTATGTGVGNVSMSAQTSGPYAGILYFQDANNRNAGTISATSATTTMQGGLYLPSATLNYAAASPGPYTMLVAKDLSFTAATTLKSNFSSLANGSPFNVDNVQLVQ